MNTLLNRDFSLPADGWFQLVPVGEHRLRLNRKSDAGLVQTLEKRGVAFPPGDRVSVIQVIDADAIRAMANSFQAEAQDSNFAGLLVDEDHFSEDLGKSSAARGWIENVEPRGDGLYGRIRLVDDTDITRGRFRFLSPVFDPFDVVPLGNNRVRPTRLDSAALTNKPNMRTIKPLSNRDGERKESEMDYRKELLGLLKLADDATDDQIGEACSGMKNRLTATETLQAAHDATQQQLLVVGEENKALKNRAEQAEATLAGLQRAEQERLVEADLTEFAGVIGNREEAKAQLLANRDGARKLLGALKAKAEAPQEPLRNRDSAQHPSEDQQQKMANRIRQQTAVVDAILAAEQCSSRVQAVELARVKHPELFA